MPALEGAGPNDVLCKNYGNIAIIREPVSSTVRQSDSPTEMGYFSLSSFK